MLLRVKNKGKFTTLLAIIRMTINNTKRSLWMPKSCIMRVTFVRYSYLYEYSSNWIKTRKCIEHIDCYAWIAYSCFEQCRKAGKQTGRSPHFLLNIV